MPRTGRRPGPNRSREQILAAARKHFASAGYDGATVRGIAATAKVDPALVLHYFGSKEGVFRAAIEFPLDPAEVVARLLEPGLEGLGERMVRFFLETWESPRGRPLLAILRSVVNHEDAAGLMRGFLSRELLGRLAAALRTDRPDLRASLAFSHLIGLALARYIVKVEPLASADADTLAAWAGPVIQKYLTGPLPG
ncbi:MAG TPA: TetR family transcriptional regulator [Candidatus Acidoferrales bacterium]|nr:TetR family transcriptional regulator [Candidatus Acidoferrales bacterium]